ncbi:MAG: PA2169 family four-helix-bundle protein [Phycisphaeraceae bacterium]
MLAFVSLTPQATGQLQMLVRLNLESQKCFRAAGDRVEDAELTALFYAYARQRAGFAAELSRYVAHDASAATPGDGAARRLAAVHRWWHSLRQHLVTDASALSLRLAARAEAEVRAAYEQVLRHPPHEDVVPALQRQRDAVASTSDRLRRLHEAREVRRLAS